jgi:hypothetical protein
MLHVKPPCEHVALQATSQGRYLGRFLMSTALFSQFRTLPLYSMADVDGLARFEFAVRGRGTILVSMLAS